MFPQPSTQSILLNGSLLIDSHWQNATGNRRFELRNPATGDIVGTVPDATDEDVRRAITAASQARDRARTKPAIERARLLRRAADLIRERRTIIAAVLTAEQGKPLSEASGEVEYAASFFEWFAGEAERIYGQVVASPFHDKRVLVLKQPVGVTAAITPWNFPAAMLTRKLGPAIAAGCTSIVKPADSTPLTAIEICRAIQDAGAEPGFVNLITSLRPAMVAEVLLGDERVRKLSFTGSTLIGKDLIRHSADNVTRLGLELGGHAPAIVFEDADLGTAVDQVIASNFRNAGQTCICANRIYVQRRLHQLFLENLAARTASLVVGNGASPGTDIGPLINREALEKVKRHVSDAISHGARIVVGGTPLTNDEYARGHFFAPTLLDGITEHMVITQEETFGPVAGITPFDTEDEAVGLANNTRYELAAYIFTRDYARLLRVADRLDFGVIGANDGAPSVSSAPFGGIKESGFGREGGAFGIDEYLDVKYISIGSVN